VVDKRTGCDDASVFKLNGVALSAFNGLQPGELAPASAGAVSGHGKFPGIIPEKRHGPVVEICHHNSSQPTGTHGFAVAQHFHQMGVGVHVETFALLALPGDVADFG